MSGETRRRRERRAWALPIVASVVVAASVVAWRGGAIAKRRTAALSTLSRSDDDDAAASKHGSKRDGDDAGDDAAASKHGGRRDGDDAGDDAATNTADDDAGADDAAGVGGGPDPEDPPHLVLILADDMGYNDIGYNRAPHQTNQVSTPFLDELASEGVTLTRYYTQCDCSPSRGALLTGLYPASTGLYHGVIVTQSHWGLPLEYHLIPQFLPSRYRSHAIGKWDVGHYTWNHVPTGRGFHSYVGFYGTDIDYYTHEIGAGCNSYNCSSAIKRCMNDSITDLNYDGAATGDEYYNRYSTDIFTDRAVELLRTESARNPLFLYVAFNAVHGPLEADDATIDRFNASFLYEARTERATFAAAALLMDRAVESIVKTMHAVGAYDNSIVLFASDNGATLAQTGGGSNWPLRGSKFTPYEGGVRVPAFLHSPLLGSGRRGITHAGLFHVTDILPTLVHAAGGSPPSDIDGVNQYHALFGSDATASSPRADVLVHVDVYGYETEAMGLATGAYIEGDLKVVVNATEATWCAPDSETYRYADECWDLPATYCDKVAENKSGYAAYFHKTYLFDLSVDPEEQHDLKDAMPAKFRKLYAAFQAHVDDLHAMEYKNTCTKSDDCDEVYMRWIDNGCVEPLGRHVLVRVGKRGRGAAPRATSAAAAARPRRARADADGGGGASAPLLGVVLDGGRLERGPHERHAALVAAVAEERREQRGVGREVAVDADDAVAVAGSSTTVGELDRRHGVRGAAGDDERRRVAHAAEVDGLAGVAAEAELRRDAARASRRP
ncbi:sulfuric ester hydrolase [Aureococcus anophagefferens]|uniref:Sulfuric ester hydrolase n=1 Tax=Aureococcus anophagefferens TaxID=44056 RepID=A0ABR1FGJ3_AURAN